MSEVVQFSMSLDNQRRRNCVSIEIWKPNRRIRTIRAGMTLRIQAPAPFQLRWSQNEWSTTQETTATATALNIYYADLPPMTAESGSSRFTFFWLADDRWEGRDYQITVHNEW
jgi:glucoamylase